MIMPKFSKRSANNLKTCHSNLQALFNKVIKHFDCIVISGHRDREEQDRIFEEGHSQLKYPQSKHNTIPSDAVDVMPYPVNWADTKRMYFFAGFVKGIAAEMGIAIRWGGDWDGDTEVRDNRFNDLVHFELMD